MMPSGTTISKDVQAFEKVSKWLNAHAKLKGTVPKKGEAVRKAITAVGHLTPLRGLSMVASHLFNGEVAISTVNKFRRDWRKSQTPDKQPVTKNKKSKNSLTEAEDKMRAYIKAHPELHASAPSIKEAVFTAIESPEMTGNVSSAPTLQLIAEYLSGRKVDLPYVYKMRVLYRQLNNLPADCRTLRSQPRRDQLPDNMPLSFTAAEFKAARSALAALRELFLRAHSIDQLRAWADEAA